MAKRKIRGPTKAERKVAQEIEMERLLRRIGYKGTAPKESVHNIPDYSTNNYRITSNAIPGNGSKKTEMLYTGNQIMGICQLHKSNATPIRRDNPQAAIDAAQMRRN